MGGQITAYATMLLGNQHRTHAFSVLVIQDYARLIRWDRGGAIEQNGAFVSQPAAKRSRNE